MTDFLESLAGPPAVLTGAGMSTDSGIPDYRGPHAPVRMPMTIAEFRSGPVARQRYWARSHLGWQRMHYADPNAGHLAVADLQHHGALGPVITQNVDGLHTEAIARENRRRGAWGHLPRAQREGEYERSDKDRTERQEPNQQHSGGSSLVIDLHGRIDRVICLDCRTVSGRSELHLRLLALNIGFGAGLDLMDRPDGDVELENTSSFTVADCTVCGGILKPDVVFFGENVPPARVAECYTLVESAAGLLVLGSSLTVQSGLRFVRRAHQRGIGIAIVNRGPTRGDEFATLRLDAGCSQTLSTLVTNSPRPTA